MATRSAVQACIFCQDTEGNLTEEHLLADWISWAFHPHRKPKQYRLWHKNLAGSERSRRAASINITFPVLCGVCNNEWFSQLENEHVKPLIEPMMLHGTRTVLTVEDQIALSAWIFSRMVIFNHGLDEPANHMHSPNQRSKFRESLEPPDSVKIWLGRFVGRTPTEIRPITGALKAFDPRVRRDAMRYVRWYPLTLNVRQLAIQMIAVKRMNKKAPPLEEALRFFEQGSEVFRDYLVTIWPPSDVDVVWPPPSALNGVTFEALRQRFGRIEPSLMQSPVQQAKLSGIPARNSGRAKHAKAKRDA
jgi:hypothetical protein